MQRAFTLIELLIVVAIIAILAAIAVPNFLEAQTRSKVSRMKADNRTMLTALQAYNVDTNRFPPNYAAVPGNPMPAPDARMKEPDNWGFGRLTSPIAYITSIPRDVFNPKFPPDYFNWGKGGTSPGYYPQYSQTGFLGDGREICMSRSWGPDFKFNKMTTIDSQGSPYIFVMIPYDPTNGTVSKGDVYAFAPGEPTRVDVGQADW